MAGRGSRPWLLAVPGPAGSPGNPGPQGLRWGPGTTLGSSEWGAWGPGRLRVGGSPRPRPGSPPPHSCRRPLGCRRAPLLLAAPAPLEAAGRAWESESGPTPGSVGTGDPGATADHKAEVWPGAEDSTGRLGDPAGSKRPPKFTSPAVPEALLGHRQQTRGPRRLGTTAGLGSDFNSCENEAGNCTYSCREARKKRMQAHHRSASL